MRMVSCPFRLSVFHKSNYNAIIVRQLTDAKRNMGPKTVYTTSLWQICLFDIHMDGSI